MSISAIFLITLGFTILLVYRVWLYAVKIENFSIIDCAWSSGFAIQAILFLNFTEGYRPRKLLAFTMLALWSLRLAYYLTYRIVKHHPEEDTRYQNLRTQYGADYRKRFLKFFIYQGVSISVLTLPFLFVFNNASENMALIEYIAAAAFFVFLAFESLADWQLNHFKAQAQNKGRVCNTGLWKYSRHPNYFFESCIWFSFYLFALGTPQMWWAFYAPAAVLFLLVNVTGVPPAEAQALKTRGDAYREYQKTTSAFVPWFKKSH